MKKLLPYYEAELQRLKESAEPFSERYPAVAGRLMLGVDDAQDPHVERLIQSFALIAARIHKRIDDDLPLITESLLDVLYPHYLRPFPSCSIARIQRSMKEEEVKHYARGTALQTRPIEGKKMACEFRSAYAVNVTPIHVHSAQYRHIATLPQSLQQSGATSSLLSLKLELGGEKITWLEAIPDHKLRFYLGGAEPALVSALRDALCNNVRALSSQDSPNGLWSPPESGKTIELVGFADDEALLDYDQRSHPAYRLLSEYFAFPEKFNFLDIPIAPSILNTSSRTITLHFVLTGIRSDSDQARVLESVSPAAFVLGCTPVVNLFKAQAVPVRVSHIAAQYPIAVSATDADAYEIYSIDKVVRMQEAGNVGKAVGDIKPFFSLKHDDLLGKNNRPTQRKPSGRYWHAQRDEDIALLNPGHEIQLSVVDDQFNPTDPQAYFLSLAVTATNRDIPGNLLSFRDPEGDLLINASPTEQKVNLLKKPSPTYRFERGRGSLWRLISHLSLNHLSLSGRGVESLQEMLRLYDLPCSLSNQLQIEALSKIEFSSTVSWLNGKPFATFVRGTEVRLVVNEDNFAGTGLSLFAAVLDRFFGLYAHLNSFTQLKVVSARTGEVLVQCPSRSGLEALV
jgi:type VI secretion system protein ImpG